jgi:hypothetical protein
LKTKKCGFTFITLPQFPGPRPRRSRHQNQKKGETKNEKFWHFDLRRCLHKDQMIIECSWHLFFYTSFLLILPCVGFTWNPLYLRRTSCHLRNAGFDDSKDLFKNHPITLVINVSKLIYLYFLGAFIPFLTAEADNGWT